MVLISRWWIWPTVNNVCDSIPLSSGKRIWDPDVGHLKTRNGLRTIRLIILIKS